MTQHKLPALPFAENALEPHISAETIQYHYAKHHAGYVEKLNTLIQGTEFAKASLEEIVMQASGPIFNNAAQVWNHSFYWNCLSPEGGGEAGGDLASAIADSFDSFSAFRDEFSEAAINNFGSGWTWLVKDADGALAIVNTSNAGNPLTDSRQPLLTCDVWEHAYYIDYRNSRAAYIENFWKLLNWDFVAQNFNR